MYIICVILPRIFFSSPGASSAGSVPRTDGMRIFILTIRKERHDRLKCRAYTRTNGLWIRHSDPPTVGRMSWKQICGRHYNQESFGRSIRSLIVIAHIDFKRAMCVTCLKWLNSEPISCWVRVAFAASVVFRLHVTV